MMRIIIFFTIMTFLTQFTFSALAQMPLNVLEYRQTERMHNDRNTGTETTRRYYNVKPNDTLAKIIARFYGNTRLDRKILQMVIVKANKHAFANGNPNFLFARKRITLPSQAEIQKMVMGEGGHNQSQSYNNMEYKREIYFVGF